MSFYVPGDDPVFEIDVDDPGYGRLHIRRLDSAVDDGGGVPQFAGLDVGRLLATVTQLALSADASNTPQRVRSTRGDTFVVDRQEARQLLPSLTRAVVLAGAGTDRYERTIGNSEQSPEPLCANCNEGSPYTGTVTISSWCTEYGHTPYGTPTGTNWTQAVECHARRAGGSAK